MASYIMIMKMAAGMLLIVAATSSAQTIRGTVISRSTQQPVPQVMVSLVQSDGAVVRGLTTDGSGQYIFEVPATGEHRIRAERFGFHTYLSDVLQIASSGSRLNVQLQDSVIPISPVTVPAEMRSKRLASVGLYERAQGGNGTFILRDEIEKRQPLKITDLLQGRAGIRVVAMSRAASALARDIVMRSGAGVIGRGRYCLPRVYLDGALIRMGGSEPPVIALDEVAKPEDIEGVELYKTPSQVPPQYGGSSSACGVVLIWTRTT